MGPRRLRRFGVGTALVVVAASVAGFLSRGAAATSAAIAPPVSCDLTAYKPLTGLTAAAERDGLAVTWEGQNGSELRARYAIDSGQPVIRELAVRKAAGAWATLGQNLTPEYYVVSGVRRMTTQQGQPLEGLGVEDHAGGDREEQVVRLLGCAARDAGASASRGCRRARPRSRPERRRRPSLRRAARSQGDSQDERDVLGGIVRREDRRRAARGDVPRSVDGHLHRKPALHRLSRHEPVPHGSGREDRRASVAYKYEAGLKGFSTSLLPRVAGATPGATPQQYQFGGVTNDTR